MSEPQSASQSEPTPASQSDVRVRFAPSPTGDLHVGSVRTALFNWLHARAKGGTYIVRIEDTDRKRSTPEALATVLEGLEWLGLTADEGPFLQSERGDLYREKLDALTRTGGVYPCWCSREDLDAKRQAALAEGKLYRYDRECFGRGEGPGDGTPFVLRARLPQTGEVVINDLIKGDVTIKNEALDDFIVARADGTPTYNFVVVVDDVDMRISHVIRGDDHLNNTPKQIHLYDLLGARRPQFAHMPMVHGPGGKKMSKRDGAASVLEFRDLGYLPETIIAFLARLGWSHGDQEEFTIDELKQLFDIADANASASVFDPKKLDWLSGRRFRELAPHDLLERGRGFLAARGLDADLPWVPRAVAAVQERANTLVELCDKIAPFYERGALTFDEKARAKFITEESVQTLRGLADALDAVETWVSAHLEAAARAFVEANELKMKHIGQPSRVALVGGTVSPGIFDCMEIYGRELTLSRLRGVLPPA